MSKKTHAKRKRYKIKRIKEKYNDLIKMVEKLTPGNNSGVSDLIHARNREITKVMHKHK